MEKYAVIKLGSKQYLVHEGDVVKLERQKKPLNIEVLMYSDGSKVEIGNPTLNVSVKASVVEEKLGEKIRVARFKKKSRYDKVKGHRQPISIIKIESIGFTKENTKEKEEKKVEEKVIKKTEKKTEKKETVNKKEVAKKPVKKLKGKK